MAADSGLQSGVEQTPAGTVPPGAMSALLRELASTPIVEFNRAWPRPLGAGSLVGRFELLRELGRGGFGVVYEARDRVLGRLVAFKAVRPGARAADLQRQSWLWHEAEAAAQLSHPNIVTLYDVGTSDFGPYLVFELLHGETMSDRLHRGPMPVREVVTLAIGVARALAYAHAAGVVHRDLKPANVFLTEGGGVKVLDFGLAHVFGTSALAGGGTPTFMAPEQCRGGPEDARTDVFGLGALMFNALTGRPPYELREGRTAALDGGAAPRPAHEGVPAALADIVQRSLAPEPGARPRDGGAMLEELLSIERAVGPRRRSAFRWAIGASLAVVIAVIATLLAVRGATPWRAVRSPYVVAVTDAVNETGEPELDSLSGLLITSLEQSRRFRVLTRERLRDVLGEMGHVRAAQIDEAAGRKAAAHARANAVLIPVVRRFGAIYSVELKGFEPASDSYLFAIEERGTDRQSIPAVIDRLSERTRRALRESAEEIEQARISVADSVTHDLEAYRHYFLGLACLETVAMNGTGCVPHFRRALEIDPTFALAQYQLAYLAEFGFATTAEQREAFDQALKHLDRFPARERMYMLAWRAHLAGDDAQAISIYERLVAAYPEDKDAQYLAGDLHFHLEEFERAIPYFERAIALDPSYEPALLHILQALSAAGRNEEMLAVARRAVERHPGPRSQRLLAGALAMTGDPAALEPARRAAEQSEGAARDEDEAILQALLLFFGRYSEAEERFRSWEKHAPEWEDRRRLLLATRLAYQGHRRDALRALDVEGLPADSLWLFHSARVQHLMGDGDVSGMKASLRWLRDHDPRRYGDHAARLAYLRQFDAAAEAARSLEPGSPNEKLYRAVLRWRGGDPSGAADDLAPLASRVPANDEPLAYEPWFYAEALVEAGRDEEAIAALRRFQRICPWFSVYRSWAYPRSLFLLARAHARRGERDEALRNLDQLLLDWRDADRDAPLLRDAAQLRATIVGSDAATR